MNDRQPIERKLPQQFQASKLAGPTDANASVRGVPQKPELETMPNRMKELPFKGVVSAK